MISSAFCVNLLAAGQRIIPLEQQLEQPKQRNKQTFFTKKNMNYFECFLNILYGFIMSVNQ